MKKCASRSNIGAGAYTPEKAEDLIAGGWIDAVVLGRDTSLTRIWWRVCNVKANLTTASRKFYGGGAKAKTDYPTCVLSLIAASHRRYTFEYLDYFGDNENAFIAYYAARRRFAAFHRFYNSTFLSMKLRTSENPEYKYRWPQGYGPKRKKRSSN